jgi:hypothetical protein
MNDFDDTTFARFARRFARIEELVPAPTSRVLVSATAHQRAGVSVFRSAVLLGATALLAVALSFVALSSRPAPTVTLPPALPTPTAGATIPPDSADAVTVLDAYLSQVQAGNCDAAARLISAYSSRTWHDALCGGVTNVTAFRSAADPVHYVRPNEVVIATVLTTTGTAAGFPAGEAPFHFRLQQQERDAWRVVDWYPGRPLDPSWTFPTHTVAISCQPYGYTPAPIPFIYPSGPVSSSSAELTAVSLLRSCEEPGSSITEVVSTSNESVGTPSGPNADEAVWLVQVDAKITDPRGVSYQSHLLIEVNQATGVPTVIAYG